MVPVIDEALAVKPPSYGVIFKLDKFVRDWDAPDISFGTDQPTPPPLALVFYNYALNGYKEMSTSLNIAIDSLVS